MFLTNISIDSNFDVGKQCRPEGTRQLAASDQGLHSLLAELVHNLLYNRVFNCFKQRVYMYYVSINSFVCCVSKNGFLEQHVYNNMMFMSLILD